MHAHVLCLVQQYNMYICMWGLEPQLFISQCESKTASHSDTHTTTNQYASTSYQKQEAVQLTCQMHPCVWGGGVITWN